MDLGATFSASSYWSDEWMDPRLDSKTGIHSGKEFDYRQKEVWL